MSTQVSLRLADDLVTAVDELVRSGAVSSRAEVMESALERELRRRRAEHDAEVYARESAEGDLGELESWLATRSTPALDD